MKEGLQLHNTLSGKKEKFEPQKEGEVSMYVCGLTVSDSPHLGHARTWIAFDIIHRWLEYKGYEVKHVENVTDIDDKIINKAKKEDVDPEEIASRYSKEVYDSMKDLNLKRVDVRPHVTEHIKEIIELVKNLIEKEYGYETSDGVYFDVSKFSEYGKLSGQKTEKLQQGEEDADKKSPEDFALWKKTEEGPRWESPWGKGRPGWHIECSVMSTQHLGKTIDIHGGGNDLVFPHHENEIAQTEGSTGKKFTKYWLHTGMLQVEKEKMSTSLQNFWTVQNALEEYSPNELRFFLLGGQYRSPLSLDKEALEEAKTSYHTLKETVKNCEKAIDSGKAETKNIDKKLREKAKKSKQKFKNAMNEDFNTPKAISSLFELEKTVNKHLEQKTYDYQGLFKARQVFIELGKTLGIQFRDKQKTKTDDIIKNILQLREKQRQKGNYEVADEIRETLKKTGIQIQDTEEGPKYSFKS